MKRHKTRRPGIMAGLLAVLLMLAVTTAIVSAVLVAKIFRQSTNFLFSTRPDVLLPNLVGTEAAAAQSDPAAAQLEVVWQEAYDSTAPAGTICRQQPGAGRTLKAGQQLTLTVSLGVQWVEVPDTKGMNQTEAGEALRAAGLTVAAEFLQDNTIAAYTVVRTDPEPGTLLAAGETVTMTIAKPVADPYRSCPSLYGLNLAEARRQVAAVGLSPITVPGSAESGTVYDQEPEPGYLVKAYGGVKIYVR